MPLKSSALIALAMKYYAGLFRGAAARLRSSSDAHPDYHTLEECGRMVIKTFELGYLPEIPELRPLVDWCRGDGSHDGQPGMRAVLVRCPANLFLEIVGGHRVMAQHKGDRLEILADPIQGTTRTGGILPEYVPAFLSVADNERAALTCEWLADLIDRHGTVSAPPDAPNPPRQARSKGKGTRADACRGYYLQFLGKGETPPTMAEIARHVGCSQSTVSRALKGLEDQRRELARNDARERHRLA